MKIKTLTLILALALITSVLTATLVLIGTHYFPVTKTEDHDKPFSFFSKNRVVDETHYVEVKNHVITLRGATSKERYLLLDLAFTAKNKDAVTATEESLPKIKGVLVEMFSGMDYSTAREMSVSDLRKQLSARLNTAFGKTMPFNDVTISKMVYQ